LPVLIQAQVMKTCKGLKYTSTSSELHLYVPVALPRDEQPAEHIRWESVWGLDVWERAKPLAPTGNKTQDFCSTRYSN
jgi:hypothetical protein